MVTKKSTVTSRFVKAMNQVIMNNKVSGGDITTVLAFAKSIGYHDSSNFSKFSSKNKSERAVTVDMIEGICKKHGVNPNYLILDKGAMFEKDSAELETLIAKLRRALK